MTNTARGARVAPHAVDDELRDLCLRTARAVGGGAVAIDLFEGPDGLLVNEVNGTMEFRNSVEPTGVDLPRLLVQHAMETARSAYTAAFLVGGVL